MVKPTSYSISLTFKWKSTAVVLVRPLAVVGRVPRKRVCPCFHPAVCWWLSWHWIIRFPECWHGTRKPYQVVGARFFGKTFFAPQNRGSGPEIGQK